jgi:hypothetical protein
MPLRHPSRRNRDNAVLTGRKPCESKRASGRRVGGRSVKTKRPARSVSRDLAVALPSPDCKDTTLSFAGSFVTASRTTPLIAPEPIRISCVGLPVL